MPRLPLRHSLLLAAACTWAAGCARPPAAARTKDGGAPRRAERIVSLAPSLTEIAFALGAGGRIVGVDDYSDEPETARRLPHLGPYLTPRFEDILALRPDLVLLQGIQSELGTRLTSAGIGVRTFDIQTVEDVRRVILEEGAALGADAAARHAVQDLDSAIARARAAVQGAHRPRVLVVVDRQTGTLRNLYAAGPGSYLDELVGLAGGDDVLSRAPMRFVRIGVEDVLAQAPDIILDLAHAGDAARAASDWDALPSVPAVRDHRVHVLADKAFTTPGPGLPRVLGQLVSLLHAGAPSSVPAQR